MSRSVYISYGRQEDQVVALRLQALGTAHGLTIFVPPPFTREPNFAFGTSTAMMKLQASNIVIAIALAAPSSVQLHEIMTAKLTYKQLFILASPLVAQWGLSDELKPHVIRLDPANPGSAEQEIITRVRSLLMDQENSTILLGLLTVAVGLMLLSDRD